MPERERERKQGEVEIEREREEKREQGISSLPIDNFTIGNRFNCLTTHDKLSLFKFANATVH